MTTTAFTSEQLLLFNKTSQAYINQVGITGSREVNAALMAMNIIQDADSDENRTKRFTMEIGTGTIALVDGNGAYTGVDHNASRLVHEQVYTTQEWGGKFSIARRNIGKLSVFIASLVTDSTTSGSDAADRFIDEGYAKIIEDEMFAKMKTKVMDALEAKLNAATTDTVYGDVVIANTATLLNIDNLETGIDISTNAADAVRAVVNNLVAQKDYHGNKLQFNSPKVVFAENSVYTYLIEEMEKSRTVNQLDKALLDYWNTDAVIVPYTATTAGDAFFFTGEMPLKFISETDAPLFFSGVDEDGNLRLHVTFIFTFDWKLRNGVVKVQAAV